MYYIEVIKSEIFSALESFEQHKKQDVNIVKNIDIIKIVGQILSIVEEDIKYLKQTA